MNTIDKQLQLTINTCKDFNEVKDELTGWELNWDEEYTFKFKDKEYVFSLIDSGKSDESQNGNYPEVYGLKEI